MREALGYIVAFFALVALAGALFGALCVKAANAKDAADRERSR